MLDKVDLDIVMELFKDSRTPFVEIASRLDLAPGTIKNRYTKLKQQGKIEACSANVDLSKFGYQCKIFLIMKISDKEDKAVTMEKISKLPNVISTAVIIGDYDLFSVAVAKDMKSLDTLLKDVRSSGIEKIEISLSIRDSIPLLPDKP